MEEIENCQRQRKKHGQKGTEISRQDRKFMKEAAKGDIPFAEKEKVCRI